MNKRWKPELGETYWFYASLIPSCTSWHETMDDLYRWKMGNCFESQKEADDHFCDVTKKYGELQREFKEV